MTDEQRLMEKLQNVQNDAVAISHMVLNYDHEAEMMSIIGAAFSTWCDVHQVSLHDRKLLLHRLIKLQDNPDNLNHENASM